MTTANVFERVLIDTLSRAINEKNLYLTEKDEIVKQKRNNTIKSFLDSIRELCLEADKKLVFEIQPIVLFLESKKVENKQMNDIYCKSKELKQRYEQKEGGAIRAA